MVDFPKCKVLRKYKEVTMKGIHVNTIDKKDIIEQTLNITEKTKESPVAPLSIERERSAGMNLGNKNHFAAKMPNKFGICERN